MKHFSFKTTFFLLGFFSIAISACAPVEPKTVEAKYDKAMVHIEKGEYGLAPPILQEILRESPGTRYATYAYLKLGDSFLNIGSGNDNFDQAEINYRVFLKKSPNSHLVPYVLHRLIELNFKRNISRIFGEDYAYRRDPGHFKSVIKDYQTFYLLYPSSVYLEDSQRFRNKSIEALAEHEFYIGNWYFDHKLYPSSISRFSYILKEYPNFPRREKVVLSLIKAYKKNQQHNLAADLEKTYKAEFQVSSL